MSLPHFCLGIGWSVLACGTASSQATMRVSVNSQGVQGNGNSYTSDTSSISADGRYVVFQSYATNLVSQDWNRRIDIFVHDRVTGTTERVNVDSNGKEANDDSYGAAISSDGHFVAFFSWAGNLVPGDTNGTGDIFVHDRVTGTTELISVDQNGGAANGPSFEPSISADGRFVAFSSLASDLVGTDTNNNYDILVRDRQLGTNELVTVDSSGNQGDGGGAWPSVSGDGMIVAFSSDSTNLVSGDTNRWLDIFVHDRSTGITERVSVDSAGNESNGDSNYSTISSDGEIVSFESYATNLDSNDANGFRDVFVHDRGLGLTECVSLNTAGSSGNDESRAPAGLSSDGRFVAFGSAASDIVPNDTNNYQDVFVRDRATGITERVSVDSSGNQGNHGGGGAAISANGESVAFYSGSANLVPNDSNGFGDAFVRDRCDAIWLNYGAGFPGTNGTPSFTAQSDPILGSTLSIDLDNSYGSATVGLLFIGFQRAEMPTAWGGELLVVPTFTLWLSLPSGITTFSGSIANDPALCQFTIDLQAIEADPGTAKGVSFTRGLELILGY